ncbi:MAG: ankyrin repeat domain-containing protein [Archangium sp.]
MRPISIVIALVAATLGFHFAGVQLRLECHRALLTAAGAGDDQRLRLLLGVGCNDRGGPWANSALFDAVRAGHRSTARLLLENGWDPLVGNKADGSALHQAVVAGDEELALEFLRVVRLDSRELVQVRRAAQRLGRSRVLTELNRLESAAR